MEPRLRVENAASSMAPAASVAGRVVTTGDWPRGRISLWRFGRPDWVGGSILPRRRSYRGAEREPATPAAGVACGFFGIIPAPAWPCTRATVLPETPDRGFRHPSDDSLTWRPRRPASERNGWIKPAMRSSANRRLLASLLFDAKIRKAVEARSSRHFLCCCAAGYTTAEEGAGIMCGCLGGTGLGCPSD